MKNPFSVRLIEPTTPDRFEAFKRILIKRGANPTDVIRGLVDAYILSDGQFEFPVKLEPLTRPDKGKRK